MEVETFQGDKYRASNAVRSNSPEKLNQQSTQEIFGNAFRFSIYSGSIRPAFHAGEFYYRHFTRLRSVPQLCFSLSNVSNLRSISHTVEQEKIKRHEPKILHRNEFGYHKTSNITLFKILSRTCNQPHKPTRQRKSKNASIIRGLFVKFLVAV